MVARNNGLDADRLLPGEPHDSSLREDAAHWAVVYTELVKFLRASSADLTHMLDRYSRRLAFWRRRVEALEGQSPMDEKPIEARR